MDIDAQLYALQALVRIHPALGTDLYFQHTSQDAYSIFSPFYASVIKLMDLRSATLLLTILFIPSAFLSRPAYPVRRKKQSLPLVEFWR
jgi:hypothetical protein